jgi:hypothetical protein
MANIIATLLAAPKTINSHADAKGPTRHIYNELKDLQTSNDPVLAPPYIAGNAAATIAATTDATEGNFTITLNFPKYSVAVTTGNIAYNTANGAIQTAVDTALDGETIKSAYTAGDVVFGLCANLAADPVSLTANGASVAGVDMRVTTANVDLDIAAPAVAAVTVGTGSRPAEAILAKFGVIVPAGTITPQGSQPAAGDYAAGDNPFSMSPALKDTLIDEMTLSEDAILGAAFRALVGGNQ